jgi:hypothetical protein
MSTGEPGTVAKTSPSQLPVLANALLDVIKDKLMEGLRSNAAEAADRSVGE